MEENIMTTATEAVETAVESGAWSFDTKSGIIGAATAIATYFGYRAAKFGYKKLKAKKQQAEVDDVEDIEVEVEE